MKGIDESAISANTPPTLEDLIKQMQQQDLDSAKKLIDILSDKELSRTDKDNKTALHLAAISGQEEIVELLINKAPKLIGWVDKDGKTALDYAKDKKNHNEIVNLLLIKHTMSLIERGQEIIQAQEIKDHIVMVLGLTGVGKGTLINYLNGVELTPKHEGSAWKLEAKDKETLPGISISNSNSKSDTFYPAIYSPENKDFSYVDTPGFDDSRGEAYDIAAAYFRQEITKNVSSIKTLLVIPNEDLTSTSGRGVRFEKQIKSLVEFLQFNKNESHIDELKKAIALVVTQVEPPRFSIECLQEKLRKEENKLLKYRKYSQYWEEEIIASEKEINETQKNLLEVERSPLLRKETIKNAFDEQVTTGLEKNVINYITSYVPDQKLLLLWYLFKEEPGFDLLTTTRYINLIVSYYQPFNFEIFSKPIILSSQEAIIVPGEKERILELIDKTGYIKKSDIEIGLPISADSKLVVAHLANYVNKEIIKEVQKAVSIIKDCINNSNDFSSLKKSIQDKVEGLKTIIDSSNRNNSLQNIKGNLSSEQEIKKYVGYIDFFKQLDPTIEYEFGQWSTGLNNAKTKIEKLLEYESKFENGTLKINGVLISAKDVLSEISSRQGIKEIKICALNTFFLDTDFPDEQLKIAEFIPKLFLLNQAYNKATGHPCPINAKLLCFFYYPASLILKGIDLTVIAPNWKIIDHRVIDISGKDGEAHILAKAPNGQNMQGQEGDGSGKDGQSGTDGLAGKPGCSGGNFLGVGQKFCDLKNLTVNTSGGKGGAGQNGGDGGDGSNGSSGNKEWVTNRHTQCLVLPRKELGFADKSYYGEWLMHATKKLVTFNSQFLEIYASRGMDGGRGGDAGAGGAGGIGGLPGNIEIIACFKHTKTSEQSHFCVKKEGENGESGTTGTVGIGGDNGSTYTRQYVNEEVFPAFRGRGEFSSGGGSIAGTIGGTAVIQQVLVTPMQIAAHKETLKNAIKQAIKETMTRLLNEGVKHTAEIYATEILKKVVKQIGKEAMQAVGKEAAEEIGAEAAKTVLAEAATIKVTKWSFSAEGGKRIALEVSTQLGNEVAIESAKGSIISTITGFAVSLVVSLALQGIASVISAYLSSGWNGELCEINRGKAKDGTKPTEKNSEGQKSPEKTSVPKQTSYKVECEAYYKECLEIAPDFIDPDFINLCSSLTGADVGLHVDHA
jgi:ankyrin repeat protein